jgi:hypothetical protein
MSTEFTLNVSGFGGSEMLTKHDAVAKQLLNLIFMKKNTDVLNPDKGVDILSYKWQLNDSSVINNIKNSIQTQISDYTNYTVLNIAVDVVKGIILIGIELVGDEVTLLMQSDGTNTAFDIIKKS